MLSRTRTRSYPPAEFIGTRVRMRNVPDQMEDEDRRWVKHIAYLRISESGLLSKH